MRAQPEHNQRQNLPPRVVLVRGVGPTQLRLASGYRNIRLLSIYQKILDKVSQLYSQEIV